MEYAVEGVFGWGVEEAGVDNGATAFEVLLAEIEGILNRKLIKWREDFWRVVLFRIYLWGLKKVSMSIWGCIEPLELYFWDYLRWIKDLICLHNVRIKD